MKKWLSLCLIVTAAVFLAAGCSGGGQENDFSVDLAVTQTLEAIASQNQPEATQPPADSDDDAAQETPQEADVSDETGLPDQYPAQQACEQMASLAAQYLSIPVSISLANFDTTSGLQGDGCSVLAATDGRLSDVWGSRTSSLIGQIERQGWVNDMYFVGVGVTGMSVTYRNQGTVCEFVQSTGPASRDLCEADETIFACMDRLTLEEKKLQVMINCTPDQMTNLSGMGPFFTISETRIEFAAGTASQILPGDLPPQGVARFALRAAEGQTMTVTLTSDPENSTVLSVWGEDQTLYLSGLDMVAEWSMDLPADQDYFIDIKNISEEDSTYQLTIEIPPQN